MELKHLAGFGLVGLLVVMLLMLAVRALDFQAASGAKSEIEQIKGQIEAIQTAGGAEAPGGPNSVAMRGGVMVYYFHGNVRCPTCEAIEAQAHETLKSRFAAQLERGEIGWKTINYEQPAAVELVDRFAIQMPVVVLVKMKDGKIGQWRRLDKVWGLVKDKPAFAQYLREEVDQMLKGGEEKPAAGKKIAN